MTAAAARDSLNGHGSPAAVLFSLKQVHAVDAMAYRSESVILLP